MNSKKNQRNSRVSNLGDIKNYAKRYFLNSRGSHDWDHIHRVYNLCMHIGDVEGADMEILKIAATLHDVGRRYQDESKGAVCHAEKGAEIAQAALLNYSIPRERMNNIIHAIRAHRFRGSCQPETLEAKVLFDADKLDSIGAIGIGRAFQFAGEIGAALHIPDIDPEDTRSYTKNDTGYREFKVKLLKIKGRMLTAEGSRIAQERHLFMEMFFDRFLQEYESYES